MQVQEVSESGEDVRGVPREAVRRDGEGAPLRGEGIRDTAPCTCYGCRYRLARRRMAARFFLAAVWQRVWR